jgi:hypothetical protein
MHRMPISKMIREAITEYVNKGRIWYYHKCATFWYSCTSKHCTWIGNLSAIPMHDKGSEATCYPFTLGIFGTWSTEVVRQARKIRWQRNLNRCFLT